MLPGQTRRDALLGLAGMLGPAAARAATLRLCTEDFPPMNFRDRDGQPRGWNVDVVSAIVEQASLATEFLWLPWARALQTARQEPDCGLFPVTRTPERDPWFTWIGTISEPAGGFLVRADSPLRPQRLEDLHGLRIGVVNQDIRFDWLLREGFKPGRELDVALAHRSNLRKLLLGRIDCWPVNLALARQLANEEGPDTLGRLRLALPIDSAALSAGRWRGNWLALHPEAPRDWVERLGRAHEVCLHAGVMERARQTWQGEWP